MNPLSHPVSVTWWDDAILIARLKAARTGRRHAVRRRLGMWHVSEVGA